MATLTITKLIEFEEELTEEQILEKMRHIFCREFKWLRIKNRVKNKKPRLRCRIKTSIINPIVRIVGTIDIQVKGKKAKILIDANTKTNFWFWFEVCFIPFSAGLMIICMYFQWKSQSKTSFEALSRVLDRLEFETSKI